MTDPYHSWDPDEATPESDGKPDAAIVPYVEALRDAGVVTLQSCSGHVHPDGTRTDGVLWIAATGGVMSWSDAAVLAYHGHGIHYAKRAWQRGCESRWEVAFPGLAESEESLRRSMESLFGALGVDPP